MPTCIDGAATVAANLGQIEKSDQGLPVTDQCFRLYVIEVLTQEETASCFFHYKIRVKNLRVMNFTRSQDVMLSA